MAAFLVFRLFIFNFNIGDTGFFYRRSGWCASSVDVRAIWGAYGGGYAFFWHRANGGRARRRSTRGEAGVVMVFSPGGGVTSCGDKGDSFYSGATDRRYASSSGG